MKARPQRGATLLELVVSAGLMALALFIASDVLIVSQQRSARAARALENTPVSLVLARLRHDVRDAHTIAAPASGSWSHEGLVLETAGGGRIRWALRDTELVRERWRAGGVGVVGGRQQQVVLTNVSTFRWRRMVAPLRSTLDVELVDRIHDERIATVSPATGAVPTTLRRRVARIAVRGGGGRSW